MLSWVRRTLCGDSPVRHARAAVLPGRSSVRGETPIGRKRRARRMARELAETHPDAHCELDFTTPLELAVATILSAQATDKRVNEVTPTVFAQATAPPPTTPPPTAASWRTMLRPTGFFRDKTDSLIKLGQALLERYDGEVPGTLADLVSLPGHRPQDRQRDPRQRVRRPRHHRRHPLPAAGQPLRLGRTRTTRSRSSSRSAT